MEDDEHLAGSPEAARLDKTYRLLREDLLSPLRDKLAEMKAVVSARAADGRPVPPWGKLRDVFQPVYIRGVECHRRPSISLSVQLPKSHHAASMTTRAEREQYWTDYGRGTFPIDALVCLVCVTGGDVRPIVYATVARRELKELADDLPTIGLALLNPGDGARKLLAALAGVPTPRMIEDERQREEELKNPGKGQRGWHNTEHRGPLPPLPVTEQQLLPGVALVQVNHALHNRVTDPENPRLLTVALSKLPARCSLMCLNTPGIAIGILSMHESNQRVFRMTSMYMFVFVRHIIFIHQSLCHSKMSKHATIYLPTEKRSYCHRNFCCASRKCKQRRHQTIHFPAV
jgi:hypothetical protein